MKIHSYLIALFTIVSFFGFSQNRNATVIGTINLGETEYCFLNEEGTSTIFKSSPYRTNELNTNQLVQIRYTENEGQVQVLSGALSADLYAQKEEENNEFFPPVEISPTLEYEILFFENEEKAREYYEWVELYIDQADEDLDIDALLDNVEGSFSGYESFRTFFNKKYDFEHGEFTDLQIEEIEEEDFLADDVLKTLLNKDRLVGIGNEIIYFHGENKWVKIQKGDMDALSVLQSIEDEADLFSSSTGIMLDPHFDIKAPLFSYSTEAKGNHFITPTHKIYSKPIIENVHCSIYKKMLKVNLSECTWSQGLQEWDCTGFTPLEYDLKNIQLTINWGDGTAVQVINNYINQYISHEYSTMNTYYPTTEISYGNGSTQNWQLIVLEDGNSTSGNNIVMEVEAPCQENEHHENGYDFSGDWKMSTKLWYKVNGFGTKIGAYTHAWEKQNNGNWKRKKTNIYVFVTGDFRNDDCDVVLTKTGAKTKNNSKKVRKTKSSFITDYDIYNGDVRSLHWLKKGNVYIQKQLFLNPC